MRMFSIDSAIHFTVGHGYAHTYHPLHQKSKSTNLFTSTRFYVNIFTLSKRICSSADTRFKFPIRFIYYVLTCASSKGLRNTLHTGSWNLFKFLSKNGHSKCGDCWKGIMDILCRNYYLFWNIIWQIYDPIMTLASQNCMSYNLVHQFLLNLGE